MPLHDVVVGLDGSSSSSDALRWASGLANDTAAQVRAISTWRMPLLANVQSIVGKPPSAAFMAARAGEQIDRACAEAGVAGIPTQIAEDDAGELLVGESSVADLVVLGRTGSGHRGPARLLADLVLGSTTRYCLHHARGPVAVVPAHAEWVPNPAVAVGIDGSPSSIAALRWAIDKLPAASTIHAVWAVSPYLEGLLAVDRSFIDRTVEDANEDLRLAITAAQEGANRADVSVEPMVVVENARYALTEPEFDVDLIVVGARGGSSRRGPLLGSTSDHVVRHAKCAVVVVPSEEGVTQ